MLTRWILAIGAALLAAVGIAGVALGDAHHDAGPDPHAFFHLNGPAYTVGLFGDMPYGEAGRVEYPRLLADMNRADLAFSVFDGDLKSGAEGPCDDALYTRSKAWFDSLRAPVVVVPGDNDWTDCWGLYGPGTGGFDPLERLDHERQVFFSTDQSLGQHTMTLQRESSEPAYAAYRENVRWTRGPVVYVGLNVQGSNDNFPHAGVDDETRSAAEIARMAREHAAREQANVHWLHESYAYAKRIGAKGVVVVWQADPNFNGELHLDPLQFDGYAEIVPALRNEVIAFPGKSVLVHGDSHYYKVDKPLSYDNGQVVAKFTRVETFGAGNTHWATMTVDPRDPNLFEFSPQIVASNVNDR